MTGKLIFLLLMTLIVSADSFGQRNRDTLESIPIRIGNYTITAAVDSGRDVVVSGGVKSIPEFPGGTTAWKQFLKKTINFAIPLINKTPSGIYTIIVGATVGADSILRNVHAESNAGYGMDAEVMRVIKLSPRWKPAEALNNRKLSFPLRFAVSIKIKGQTAELL